MRNESAASNRSTNDCNPEHSGDGRACGDGRCREHGQKLQDAYGMKSPPIQRHPNLIFKNAKNDGTGIPFFFFLTEVLRTDC